MTTALAPRTDLESRLLADPELQAGLGWGSPRHGHPEGSVGEHVRALLRAGKLAGSKLSDGPKARYRVPRAELERFVAERQTRAAA